jgi:hypothetical protein
MILIIVAGLVRNGNIATTDGDFTSVVDREHDERGEFGRYSEKSDFERLLPNDSSKKTSFL